ncbi:hypothetical protein OHA38_43260 (plasmid) [Streptomyces sp. NBC_01732]|nr:hypothetical protein OHA38_43260 [Streptomyces sp. NBC_01732]
MAGEETALKFQVVIQEEAVLDRYRALVAFSEHSDFRQDFRP